MHCSIAHCHTIFHAIFPVTVMVYGMVELWNNGSPNGRAAPYAFRNEGGFEYTLVDDLVVDSDAWRLDRIIWDSAEDDKFDWAGTVDLFIFEDAGGEPSHIPLLERDDVVPLVPKTATGEDFLGNPIYRYQLDGLGITLARGTYWLGVRPVGRGSRGASAWLVSHSPPYEEIVGREFYWACCGNYEFVPGSYVFGFPADLNFQLFGGSISAIQPVRMP